MMEERFEIRYDSEYGTWEIVDITDGAVIFSDEDHSYTKRVYPVVLDVARRVG